MRALIFIAVLIGLIGCEKKIPYPITKVHIEGLKTIADDATLLCDDLLKNPDCYHPVDGDSTPDAPSLPKPSRPFDKDPVFKGLGMDCLRRLV
jgi:hypothetical protein